MILGDSATHSSWGASPENMNWRGDHLPITWLLMAAVAALVMGCGRTERAPVVYDEEDWQGAVDPNLPPAMQAKQDAMIRFFAAIDEVGLENVSELERDIRFEESFQEFFEEAADVYRWDWDGPPEEDDVFPVLLILTKDEPGLPKVEKHRKYRIRRSGQTFVISRSP